MVDSGAKAISEADAYRHTYTSAVWNAMRLSVAIIAFLESEVLFLHKYGKALDDPRDKLYEDMRAFAESRPSERLPQAVSVHWYKQITTASYFVSCDNDLRHLHFRHSEILIFTGSQ